MATRIDAKMTLDASGFKAGVEQAVQKLDELVNSTERGAKQASGSTKILTDAVRDAREATLGNSRAAELAEKALLRVGPAVGVVAVALGAVTKAWMDGSAESRKHTEALILSGNAAGVTADQLAGMARALDNGTRTQAQAAAAVDAMARNVSTGAEALQRYAGAAVDWERVTGQSVDKTAQQFRSLQDAPLAAVMRLNEGMNFLTAATYDQIKSLEDQGRKQDAARVAQDAYAKAMADRTTQITANQGAMERGWNAVKNAALGAWDAMLNVGRAQGKTDRLAQVRQELAQLEAEQARAGFASTGGGAALGNPRIAAQADAQRTARIEKLRGEAGALEAVVLAERKDAEAKAANARQVAALSELETKYGDRIKTRAQRAAEARTEIANLGAAAGKTAAEIKALQDASDAKLLKGDRAAGLRADTAAARELAQELATLAKSAGLNPDFYKEWDKLAELHKKGKLSVDELTAAQGKLLAQQPAIRQAEEARRKETEALAKAESTARDEALKRVQAHEREVDQLAAGNDKLRDEIATLGLSAREQTRYAKAKLDSAISIKEEQLARMQGQWLYTREQAALEAEIALLRERSELLGQKADRELDIEGAKAVEKTEKATEQMGQALADNLMRGGKSARQYLIDLMRTTVLRPILAPVGVAMAGLFGGTGAALAGQGGGGGVGNLAGSALNMAGGSIFGAGGLSGALMGGAGWLTGSTTFGGALGAAGSLIGTGTAGGLASGLAMGAGALAPIALGVGLLGSALGLFRSLERKGGGLTGTLGQAGGVHDVDLMRRGGSLFSGPDWFTQDKGVSALDRAIQQQFDLSKGAIKGFAETLGLASDKVDGFTTTLGTQTMGDHGQLGIRLDKDGKPLSDQEVQAAIAEAIKAGSNELAQQLIGTWSESIEQVTRTVVDTTGGAGDGWATRQVTEDRTTRSYTPSEFARDGEQAIDTLTRLGTSLQGVNSMFDTLGLGLYQTSLAGGKMASEMVDAAGGLDKLQASGAAYFQAFYTGSEQHQTALRQLRERFDELGLVMPANRAGLRDMMEGIDRNTEAGRTLTAQLLELAPQLAAVMPQLFQGGQSMSDALTQGLLGTYDGANLGAYMAQTVTDGIYNAVAGQFAGQITDIIVSGVIDPVIQAAITGSSISAAVSAASIAEMVAQANAVAAAAAQVLNDPAFRASLDQIGTAVASLRIPAQRSSGAVSGLAQATRDAGSAAESATRAVSDLAGSWRTLLGEVKGVFDVVHQAVRELRGDDANVALRAEQGRAFIDDALSAMRATGALPEADRLREAIDAARGGLRVEDFTSVADYQRQQLLLAGQLGEMEGVAGKQMSYAEQQISLLEKQNDTGKAQLEVLRAQLRLAGGTVPEPAPSAPAAPLPWLMVRAPALPQLPLATTNAPGATTDPAATLVPLLNELIRAVRAGADSSDEMHRLLQRVTGNGRAMQTETTP
ncbi:MAG: phage tail length tape measure family protein [Proteobacteria bacterium]|nr:phage tail length tape measure family protein [Pseudomonadota bacterium]